MLLLCALTGNFMITDINSSLGVNVVKEIMIICAWNAYKIIRYDCVYICIDRYRYIYAHIDSSFYYK